MNDSKKDLLKKVLKCGTLNPEKSEQIRKEIYEECGMHMSIHKDRALWSAWIRGKSTPNRFCQTSINAVLVRNQLSAIYD